MLSIYHLSSQFSSVQSFAIFCDCSMWTAAHQASLSITNAQGLLKLMSIESVMPSNRLILCSPLLLLPSIFSSIRVFSNEILLKLKREEILIHTATWMNVEEIILSEIMQTQKDKYCMVHLNEVPRVVN